MFQIFKKTQNIGAFDIELFFLSVIQDLLGPALSNLLCLMPLNAKMYKI